MDYRERYIKMRNENKYDINFFFDYYLSQGGVITEHKDFSECFLHTFEENIINFPGRPPFKQRVITGYRDRVEILQFLDKKFGVTVLEDKDKQFIKIIC